MRWFFARLSNFLNPERADRAMRCEMESHLALIEEDLVRRGMAPAEARVAARRSLGGLEPARERHREARSFVWLEQLAQDLRHALRNLARSPGFVAVAVVSLALGIGLNTAAFTLVNGILLKRLPVADPHRIVQLNGRIRDFEGDVFSLPEWREIRRRREIFSDVIGFSSMPGLLEDNGNSQNIDLQMVTGSFFEFFHARPELGRLLDEEDDRVEGAHAVCVISDHLWREKFGGNSRVVDSMIRVGGVPLQVVGVVPPGFVGAELQRRYDVWVPTALRRDLARSTRESASGIWLRALGRLAPGIGLAQANARLQSASRAIEDALPNDRANKGMSYFLTDASKGFGTWRKALSDPLSILMGAVMVVLLVACANLANLLLVRTNERRRELSIKLSLGISRWRLLRQLLLETFALSCIGGMSALFLSNWMTDALVSFFNSGNRYNTLTVEPDASVFAFTLAACVVTALLAGLYPAWQASRADANAGLKGAPLFGINLSFMRRTLILVQVVLAVVLMFGASLFTHSLRNLKTIDLGYNVERVLTINLTARGRNPKAAVIFPQLGEVLGRVRRIPGVDAAGYSWPGVLSQEMIGAFATVHGRSGDGRNLGTILRMSTSPGYFDTLHMPIVRGRDFTAADRDGSPLVAIVNQRFVARAWPGEDPIGKRFSAWGSQDIEVVGLVADSKYRLIREDASPTAYPPFAQVHGNEAVLQVRGHGSLTRLEREIRAIARTSAPGYQISGASSMEAVRDAQISKERALAFLSSLFAALADILALVGIYGLISYAAARRTREVGIRMAVGAQSRDMIWLFARESLALTAAGMVLGLPLALALARLVTKMLYQVSPADPWGIAATLTVFTLGGLLAAYLPARKAARVDPVQALRWE